MPSTIAPRKLRKSYAAKTGQDDRAANLIASAMFGPGVKTHETEDGHVIREWEKADLLKWSFDELRSVLSNRVAVDADEMLGTVPPSAIKYSVNKGWIVQNGKSGLYRITLKCALELNLPMRFRGIHANRKIPFAK